MGTTLATTRGSEAEPAARRAATSSQRLQPFTRKHGSIQDTHEDAQQTHPCGSHKMATTRGYATAPVVGSAIRIFPPSIAFSSACFVFVWTRSEPLLNT